MAGIDMVTFNDRCLTGTVFEFPIIVGGKLPFGNDKQKDPEPGTRRVLFQVDETTKIPTYCGIMVHASPSEVPNPNGGKPLDPFSSC